MKNSGFTLIEILMVVSLLAILATVAATQFINYQDDAKATVTQDRLREIQQAIMGNAQIVGQGRYVAIGFYGHLGQLPTSLNDLVNQGSYPSYDPFNKVGWRGPYLNASVTNWDKDGWGSIIQYNSVARTLTSCGPDQLCGNADDIQITF